MDNKQKNITPKFSFSISKECQECKLGAKNAKFLIFPSGKILCSLCSTKYDNVLCYPTFSECNDCKTNDKKLMCVFPGGKTLCSNCFSSLGNKEVPLPEIKECKSCGTSSNLITVSPIMEVLCPKCSRKAKLEESFTKLESNSPATGTQVCLFCKNKLSVEYIIYINGMSTLCRVCIDCMLEKCLKIKENTNKYDIMVKESGLVENLVEGFNKTDRSLPDILSSTVETLKSSFGENEFGDKILGVITNLQQPITLNGENKKELSKMIDIFKQFWEIGSSLGDNNDFSKVMNNVFDGMGDVIKNSEGPQNLESMTAKFMNIAAVADTTNKEKSEENNSKGKKSDSEDGSSDEEWY